MPMAHIGILCSIVATVVLLTFADDDEHCDASLPAHGPDGGTQCTKAPTAQPPSAIKLSGCWEVAPFTWLILAALACGIAWRAYRRLSAAGILPTYQQLHELFSPSDIESYTVLQDAWSTLKRLNHMLDRLGCGSGELRQVATEAKSTMETLCTLEQQNPSLATELQVLCLELTRCRREAVGLLSAPPASPATSLPPSPHQAPTSGLFRRVPSRARTPRQRSLFANGKGQLVDNDAQDIMQGRVKIEQILEEKEMNEVAGARLVELGSEAAEK